MCVRGGFIAANDRKLYEKFAELLPVYEGFLIYERTSTKGNMSSYRWFEEYGRRSSRSNVELIRYLAEHKFVEVIQKGKMLSAVLRLPEVISVERERSAELSLNLLPLLSNLIRNLKP